MVVSGLILVLSMVLLACSDNKGGKSKTKNENSGSAGINKIIKSVNDSEMVYFKGGTFIMGPVNGILNEQPVHKVAVQSFKIDKYPVKVREFRRFVESTGYKTDAEWEYAARCGGKSTSRFSWGEKLIIDRKYMANVWQGKDLSAKQGYDGFVLISPVGHYGETPCGMNDMGGNVWNWCLDIYNTYPGSNILF